MIENKIQSAIKSIISIYSKMEVELIEKIAEHFKINEEFINSDYWYFEKLKELGGLNNETLKLLEEYTGKKKKAMSLILWQRLMNFYMICTQAIPMWNHLDKRNQRRLQDLRMC